MARLEPFFPKSHGKPRVDDRRVLSGIIFINRNGLRWCDAPREYGPHKTLYNRWNGSSTPPGRICGVCERPVAKFQGVRLGEGGAARMSCRHTLCAKCIIAAG